ncbi:hypothetical protein [Ruegeria sp. HKCCE3926]|uniref:hypothetical protein n=1 Tax=Ruegeria sp. HKCCE3926 TaxID=2794831 RepID=UPI001AE7507D|nr:hypothetical protein [Ruegeria sp. HKCCE3926]
MNEQEPVNVMMVREGLRVSEQIERVRQDGMFTPASTVIVASVNTTVFGLRLPYIPHDPEENDLTKPETYLDQNIEAVWRTGTRDPGMALYDALYELSTHVLDECNYKTNLTDIGNPEIEQIVDCIYSFALWWLTAEGPDALDRRTSVRLITMVSEPIRQTFNLQHTVVVK